MKYNKNISELIWNKYDKKCSYCGKELEYKKMQLDHIDPLFRNYSDEELKRCGRLKGNDDISNLNPSCARCNRWKSTYTLEQFRSEISKQTIRLNRDSNQYRMSLDFGLIVETNQEVVFWFERYKQL